VSSTFTATLAPPEVEREDDKEDSLEVKVEEGLPATDLPWLKHIMSRSTLSTAVNSQETLYRFHSKPAMC
jgi:hypothetical protein